MKCRLFNLAAAVSLGMMLATVALWIRSYWRYDQVSRMIYTSNEILGRRYIESVRGAVTVTFFQEKPTVPYARFLTEFHSGPASIDDSLW